MLLYSRTLKKDVNLATFEKEENGRPIKIIFHDALENVIHNEVTSLKYFYDFVTADVNHTVVSCTITDENGRRVVGIGETVPSTLDTDIARNYPSLIASQRAFDRAAIRYLDLPGKVFSNMEISIIDDSAVIPPEPTPEPEGIVSSVVEDDNTVYMSDIDIDIESENADNTDNTESTVTSETPVATTKSEELFADDADVPTAPEVPEVPNIPNTVDKDIDIDDISDIPMEEKSTEDYGAYVITMRGKYAGKNKTIAEIYATDSSWMQWIAEKFNPSNPVAERDVAAIRKFLANK